MNAPLGVSEMIRGIPVFTEDRDRMTSVIAYVYKNHSLAFVGTKSGKLKKVGTRCTHFSYCEDSLSLLGQMLSMLFCHLGLVGERYGDMLLLRL